MPTERDPAAPRYESPVAQVAAVRAHVEVLAREIFAPWRPLYRLGFGHYTLSSDSKLGLLTLRWHEGPLPEDVALAVGGHIIDGIALEYVCTQPWSCGLWHVDNESAWDNHWFAEHDDDERWDLRWAALEVERTEQRAAAQAAGWPVACHAGAFRRCLACGGEGTVYDVAAPALACSACSGRGLFDLFVPAARAVWERQVELARLD